MAFWIRRRLSAWLTLPTLMFVPLRKLVVSLYTTPAPVAPARLRPAQAILVFGAATVVGMWIFAFLLRRYLGLGTTYDLFINVQLATSWLHGEFLHDSLFINYLSVHAYFLSPVLAILAYPFGAPGLLFAGGLAAAAAMVAMVRILRMFGVGTKAAAVVAIIATLMPLSLQVYQVDFYGFQIELLIPAVALWLAYFLFRRQWLGSLLCGLALQALKEDCVLILLPVAAVVLSEDLLRSPAAGRVRNWRRTVNLPALVVALASVLVTPLILYVVQSQPVLDPANTNGFDKVRTVDASSVRGTASLIAYMLGNLTSWLQSATVGQWLQAVVLGSFGLVFLRPHLLVVGALTTITAWLVQRDLMWAPRFAPTLAFMQLVGCLGFASLWIWWQAREENGLGLMRRRILLAGGCVVIGGMLAGQYRMAPRCVEVYRMDPVLALSRADRIKADNLFAQYRRAARVEEPVVATEYLYRYIHDRNFLWYHRLRGRPSPAWILWDKEDVPLAKLWPILRANGHGDADHYRLFAQADRFLIFRRKRADDLERERAARAQPVVAAVPGPIKMKVRIADGRAGLAEPVLSVGSPNHGSLFFFRYLDDNLLVAGVEIVGEGVYTSEPIPYAAGQNCDLELFCGSLLPAPAAGEPLSLTNRRWEAGNLVRFRFDGKDVINVLAPQTPTGAGRVFAGYNAIAASSAGTWFVGEIDEVASDCGFIEANAATRGAGFGPVRMILDLPRAPAAVPEPLLVIGEPGDATLGYIRVLAENRIQVGLEIWGWGAYESEPIEVKDPRRVEIAFGLPDFIPEAKDPIGATPLQPDSALLQVRRVSVDGVTVLERNLSAPVTRNHAVAYGRNPVGGSWVGAAFTGTILQITRTLDGSRAWTGNQSRIDRDAESPPATGTP